MSAFEELGHVDIYTNTSEDEIAERIKDADVVVANKCRLNKETMEEAVNIKLVAELATGYDNIDLDYCKSRGIHVCNVRGYSTPAVVQHTFALCFYVLEHLRHYDDLVKSGQYGDGDSFTIHDMPFNELRDKTWGIIGLGEIGKGVAKAASAFGCKVIYYSTSGKNSSNEYESVSLNELLRSSDIISCHCPLNDRTRYIINKETLSEMKKSAILINVARGAVVNNSDLYDALCDNVIAGAGLDVLDGEPITKDNPLGLFKDSNRLIITPHMAWASSESQQRCVNEAYLNVKAFCEGKQRNLVI